jgi:hypothetical protein
MRENTEFAQGTKFQKKNRGLVAAIIFAGVLNLGICSRQDRPLCGLVLKLTHGVDEQVGFVRPCLVQNRPGELYT